MRTPRATGQAEIIVAVAADGRYTVDHQAVEGRNVEVLAAALHAAAESRKEPFLIILGGTRCPPTRR